MKHQYIIQGMSCSGCRDSVRKVLETLSEIQAIEINLETKEVTLEMVKKLSLSQLQLALNQGGLHYSIEEKKHNCCSSKNKKQENEEGRLSKNGNSLILGNGVFYCPMHCEGEKIYQESGDCPVCGMDLVEQPQLVQEVQYTCPMHPEIIEYGPGDCPICGMDLVPIQGASSDEDKTYQVLLKKFKIAVLFTLPIFIIAMSEMLPDNPLMRILSQEQWNWVQLFLSFPVIFYACWMFFERAWKSIITWNLNMFTLIGIGAGVAFLFSIIALAFPSFFPEQFKTEAGTVFVYFEAATVILTLVLLGQLLEAKAHSRTSGAIKELLKLAPTEATLVIHEGEDKIIAIQDIMKGNHLRVKPGDKIPVDGIIIEGASDIDESMITGEPMPISKRLGDQVSAGTINGNKSFVMQAKKVGGETLLAQIIHMVNDASRSRAPIQKLADEISKYFVPIVIFIAILTFVIWLSFGSESPLVFAFVNSIAVLIIACPCALGLATPMSVMVGVGKGAQSGVLIKNAEALEKLNQVDVLITDKTGTITEGKPSVENVFSLDGDAQVLTKYIASLNQHSEHPLATAIVNYAKEKEIKLELVNDFEAVAGKGVIGYVDGLSIALGNKKLMEQTNAVLLPDIEQRIMAEQKLGKTVSYISVDGEVRGYVAISDAIKETSRAAINSLQEKGIFVIMLTGDNANTAKAVADELNLNNYQAGCLPEDKLNTIKELQKKGKVVAMAGDGINDAPALAQADVGIAMGTGTDVAIESSEVTLVKGDLMGIVKAKNLGDAVMKNIRQNLFFAFVYNALGIPIAAGVLYPFIGILLSPMVAAAAMSFSSVSVIMNSLRLKSKNLN